MNIQAREKLKDQAEAILFDESSTPEIRAQAHLMKIEACHAEIDSEALAILERQFPTCTKRMIETGFSHWNSYGKHERYFHLLRQKQAS